MIRVEVKSAAAILFVASEWFVADRRIIAVIVRLPASGSLLLILGQTGEDVRGVDA